MDLNYGLYSFMNVLKKVRGHNIGAELKQLAIAMAPPYFSRRHPLYGANVLYFRVRDSLGGVEFNRAAWANGYTMIAVDSKMADPKFHTVDSEENMQAVFHEKFDSLPSDTQETYIYYAKVKTQDQANKLKEDF